MRPPDFHDWWSVRSRAHEGLLVDFRVYAQFGAFSTISFVTGMLTGIAHPKPKIRIVSIGIIALKNFSVFWSEK